MFRLNHLSKTLLGKLSLLNFLSLIPLAVVITVPTLFFFFFPTYSILFRILSFLTVSLLALILALILIFVQKRIIKKDIIQPLKQVQEAAVSMANGNDEVRIGAMHRSPNEIVELAQTLNFVVNSIEERNNKLMKVYSSLAEKEATFRLISQNVPGVVYLLSEGDRSVLFINDKVQEQIGYEPEKFLSGELSVMDLIVEEDRARVIEEITQCIRADVRFNSRFQVRLKSGELRFYETFGSSFRSLKKETVIEGFATDITEKIHDEMELQQMLADKEMLIKEVHHRVKNNLAMIGSLIHLQQDATESTLLKNGLDDLDRRISSIALIHEKLYQSDDLSVVNFKNYIEELILRLKSTLSSPLHELIIETKIEGIVLPVDRSIPLGLIINELITNSVKHIDKDVGEIVIKIGMDYKDGDFILTVSDNGTGLPKGFNPSETDSLGFQLIEALTHQISGRLNFFNAGGAFFELVFPETEEFF